MLVSLSWPWHTQTALGTPNSEKTAFLGYRSEDYSVRSQPGSIDEKAQSDLNEGMALSACPGLGSGCCAIPGGAGSPCSRVPPGAAPCAQRSSRAASPRSQVAQLQAFRTHRSWQPFPHNSKQDVWSLPRPVSSSTDLKQLLLPAWLVPCSCFTFSLFKGFNWSQKQSYFGLS